MNSYCFLYQIIRDLISGSLFIIDVGIYHVFRADHILHNHNPEEKYSFFQNKDKLKLFFLNLINSFVNLSKLIHSSIVKYKNYFSLYKFINIL